LTSLGHLTLPADHVLMERSDRFRMSAYLQDMACTAGQSMVFEEAAEFMSQYLKISLSGKQIERVCHHYGEQLEIDLQRCVLKDELSTALPADKSYYVMMDGCLLMTREEKWKELKLGRIFSTQDSQATSKDRNVINESMYTAHLGEYHEFIKKMEVVIDGLPKKTFIADGAKWIWAWIEQSYPESTQILDYYHATQHLCDFAEHYFKDPTQKSDWINKQRQLLLTDGIDQVIDHITQLPKTKDPLVKNKQNSLLNYYKSNCQRMRYKTFTDLGYMIGSGPIEAAHRHVIQQRLKRSGQRWTKNGLQQMANLRIAHKSKQWHKVLNLITKAA
jgi:hypothetical protein